MILVFDTETTGLPDWKLPSDHPGQPHLVEIACLVYTDGGQLRDEYHVLVKPDGWTIPDRAAEIHGISTERALDEGIPERLAVAQYHLMLRAARLRVAHNISFDDRLMRIAALRAGMTRPEIEDLEGRPSYCTCKAAAPIVNLPPTAKMLKAGFNKPKAPNLTECFKHFFGEDLVGAHGALADAKACARVYYAMNPAA